MRASEVVRIGREEIYRFLPADMEPQVRIDDGSLIAALKSEHERGTLQFYRQWPGEELWVAIPMRLTFGSKILDTLLAATWLPGFCRDLTAVPGGFSFVFNSNNRDPPDYRFRATYSMARRAFSLRRLDRLPDLTPEQYAEVQAHIDRQIREQQARKSRESGSG